MDALQSWADAANNAANAWLLLLSAVTVLVVAFIGLAVYRRKTRRQPPRQVEGYSVGHQQIDLFEEERDIYPPTQLERVQRILRDDAARYDTDAMAEMYDHINKERDQ